MDGPILRMLNTLNNKLGRVAPTLHVVKQTLFRNDTLLAGPYSGELGLELMEWSGYVRRLSMKYNRTIVVSYQGNHCLYDPCEYYAHELRLQDSGYWYGSLEEVGIKNTLEYYRNKLGLTSFDWFHPKHLNKYTKRIVGPQIFWEPFKLRRTGCSYDVAFHFRSMMRADLDIKNYPASLASELVDRCKVAGLRVCCIGHPEYSICPDKCDDLRSRDLSETRMALEISKTIAGGSSAPMHLASLCGLPIVVWWKTMPSDPDLIDKYRSLWNPHKAPVFIVSDSTFQPAADQVFSQIIKALHSG